MFIRPRIIPVLLIDNRDLIKTIQFNRRVYLGDPINAVKIFNRKGIDELVILDIGASYNQSEPDYDILKDIATEAFMPLAYGGGIRNVDQAIQLSKIGYEKIIINTQLVKNPELIRKIAEVLGNQSVIASIDAQTIHGMYYCTINDGHETVKISPAVLAKNAEKLGAGEILINSVDQDGMMNGYDIFLVQDIVRNVNIPVIACGGARGITDLKKVIETGGAHAAAGGSMFVFYGKLRAVLITAPTEEELIQAGVYKNV